MNNQSINTVKIIAAKLIAGECVDTADRARFFCLAEDFCEMMAEWDEWVAKEEAYELEQLQRESPAQELGYIAADGSFYTWDELEVIAEQESCQFDSWEDMQEPSERGDDPSFKEYGWAAYLERDESREISTYSWEIVLEDDIPF
jgi:hypothetical protein